MLWLMRNLCLLLFTTLAHASLNGLARRSPDAFRAAVGGFGPAVRARMETAVREQASAAQAQSMAKVDANRPAAKPQIALRMNFSNFGSG